MHNACGLHALCLVGPLYSFSYCTKLQCNHSLENTRTVPLSELRCISHFQALSALLFRPLCRE